MAFIECWLAIFKPERVELGDITIFRHIYLSFSFILTIHTILAEDLVGTNLVSPLA